MSIPAEEEIVDAPVVNEFDSEATIFQKWLLYLQMPAEWVFPKYKIHRARRDMNRGIITEFDDEDVIGSQEPTKLEDMVYISIYDVFDMLKSHTIYKIYINLPLTPMQEKEYQDINDQLKRIRHYCLLYYNYIKNYSEVTDEKLTSLFGRLYELLGVASENPFTSPSNLRNLSTVFNEALKKAVKNQYQSVSNMISIQDTLIDTPPVKVTRFIANKVALRCKIGYRSKPLDDKKDIEEDEEEDIEEEIIDNIIDQKDYLKIFDNSSANENIPFIRYTSPETSYQKVYRNPEYINSVNLDDVTLPPFPPPETAIMAYSKKASIRTRPRRRKYTIDFIVWTEKEGKYTRESFVKGIIDLEESVMVIQRIPLAKIDIPEIIRRVVSSLSINVISYEQENISGQLDILGNEKIPKNGFVLNELSLIELITNYPIFYNFLHIEESSDPEGEKIKLSIFFSAISGKDDEKDIRKTYVYNPSALAASFLKGIVTQQKEIELYQFSSKKPLMTGKPSGPSKPTSGKPVSGKPKSGKPVSGKPSGPSKPASGKPKSGKPISGKRVSGKPTSGKKGILSETSLPKNFKYITLKISKAKSNELIDRFINIFSRLLTIYLEMDDQIEQWYSQYVPIGEEDKAVVIRSQNIRSTSNVGLEKIKRLMGKDSIKGYTKDCQAKFQPTALTIDEAEEWIKENGTDRLLAYPAVNPKFYFTCDHEKHPFPGIKESNNKSQVIPYIPCCYSNNQKELTNYLYAKYYLGIKDDKPGQAKYSRTEIKTLKILSPGRSGKLDTSIINLLGLVDRSYVFVRYGVVAESYDSLLHCACMSDNNYVEADMESRRKFVDKLKRQIQPTIHPECLKQELYDYSLEEIRDAISYKSLTNPKKYINSQLLYRAIEEILKINIYVFTHTVKNDKTSAITLEVPRHDKFHCRFNNREQRNILLFKHASKFQYELIIRKNTGDDIKSDINDYVHSTDIGDIMYNALNVVNSVKSIEIYPSEVVIPSQYEENKTEKSSYIPETSESPPIKGILRSGDKQPSSGKRVTVNTKHMGPSGKKREEKEEKDEKGKGEEKDERDEKKVKKIEKKEGRKEDRKEDRKEREGIWVRDNLFSSLNLSEILASHSSIITKKYQYIDMYGKARGMYVEVKDSKSNKLLPMSIITQPYPPENMESIAYTPTKTSYYTASRLFGTPSRKNVDLEGNVIGLWYSYRDIVEAIYIPITRSSISNFNVPVGSPDPLIDNINTQMMRYQELNRSFHILMELIVWVYKLYLNEYESMEADRILTIKSSDTEDIVDKFIKNYIYVDPHRTSDKTKPIDSLGYYKIRNNIAVTNYLPIFTEDRINQSIRFCGKKLEGSIVVIKGSNKYKFKIFDNMLRDGIRYHLVQLTNHYRYLVIKRDDDKKVVELLRVPETISLEDIESDFKHSRYNLILIGDQKYRQWYSDQRKPRTFEMNMSIRPNHHMESNPILYYYINPYYTKRDTKDEYTLDRPFRGYIIQNVSGGDGSKAIQVAYNWYKYRRNTGFNTPPSDVIYKHLIYTVNMDGHIDPIEDKTYNSDNYLEILQYTENRYAALLPII